MNAQLLMPGGGRREVCGEKCPACPSGSPAAQTSPPRAMVKVPAGPEPGSQLQPCGVCKARPPLCPAPRQRFDIPWEGTERGAPPALSHHPDVPDSGPGYTPSRAVCTEQSLARPT
ncbi:ubiquitin carboxyl-terminal hydrolase 36 [Platysternon megacephalum]|uniref:Ubiquitin carboxyl-terminal hydrolase 36 n=1 Tax=Platysternon megacephalum TaxID=55544 RepID=A0A4D9EKL0_9SAUR|nr:ubiquitin carboxyl-terminal hydrolase 36 [Platysternon megacephalum]